MPFDRNAFAAGTRAVLPVLLGVAPFGLITGIAMVAGGIAPWAAVAMSLVVFAGASMLAATQLLGAAAPVALIVLTALFINLRFMMYSASMRPHLGGLPLRWRLLAACVLADNPYALCIARFTEHPEMPGKLWFYLGASTTVWLAWQIAVAAGALAGSGLPAAWRLEFAAPLAFIAMSVPLLRDRAMISAALAAATTVVLLHGLPMRLGLVFAALAGIGAGMLAERRRA
jgi:4-azaleucine resistance transporter AzlC